MISYSFRGGGEMHQLHQVLLVITPLYSSSSSSVVIRDIFNVLYDNFKISIDSYSIRWQRRTPYSPYNSESVHELF